MTPELDYNLFLAMKDDESLNALIDDAEAALEEAEEEAEEMIDYLDDNDEDHSPAWYETNMGEIDPAVF